MITKSILSAAVLLTLGTVAMAEPTGVREADAPRATSQTFNSYDAGRMSYASGNTWTEQRMAPRNWSAQAEIDRSNGATIER